MIIRKVLTAIILSIIFSFAFGQHQVLVGTYDAGEQVFAAGSYSDAHSYFAQVVVQSSDKDLRARAMYMKALSSYKLGDYTNAANEFEEFERIFADHPLAYRAALYAGSLFFFDESYLNCSQQYAFALLSNNPREQRIAQEALENILWGYLPIEHFPALLDRVDRSVEGIIGALWLRRFQYDGDYARALREGQKLLQRIYEAQDKRKIQEELSKVEDYLKKNLIVAVIVPQTGDYARYGREILNGVNLAFGSLPQDVELKILDSGGDPLTTAKVVDELLRKTIPLCIIGPITSNETVAAGAIAGTYKVPLITPSASRNGIAELSPYVFQLVASPVKASAYLASFACDSMDTFAILAPDDELGRGCAMAFARLVAENEKHLLGAQFYPQGNIDFSEMLNIIKEPVLQFYDNSWRAIDTFDTAIYECFSDSGCFLRPREEWQVHIDGFFVPGYYDDIGVILPQIPFMYINTTVLGANGWIVNDLRKDKQARKYLDSCIIAPDDFYVCEENTDWDSFERAYKREFGGSPSRMASLGYDAAKLAIMGIGKNAVTQELMRDYLSGIHDYEGASGPVTFDENGANTSTNILRFDGSEVIKVW